MSGGGRKQSNILLNPKEISGAQDAVRRRPKAHCAGPVKRAGSGSEVWWRGSGQVRVGRDVPRVRAGPLRGSAGRQGARAPRDPRCRASRAIACHPAAQVFLFCVVAFVLEACIYILSVSGEWVGALIWAGWGVGRGEALGFVF